jgi:hypothetical protein
MTDPGRAIFLSYASPSFAEAAEGRQDSVRFPGLSR